MNFFATQLAFPFATFVFVFVVVVLKFFGIKHSEQQPQQIENSQNLLQGQSELETRISFWQATHTKDLGNELAKSLAGQFRQIFSISK